MAKYDKAAEDRREAIRRPRLCRAPRRRSPRGAASSAAASTRAGHPTGRWSRGWSGGWRSGGWPSPWPTRPRWCAPWRRRPGTRARRRRVERAAPRSAPIKKNETITHCELAGGASGASQRSSSLATASAASTWGTCRGRVVDVSRTRGAVSRTCRGRGRRWYRPAGRRAERRAAARSAAAAARAPPRARRQRSASAATRTARAPPKRERAAAPSARRRSACAARRRRARAPSRARAGARRAACLAQPTYRPAPRPAPTTARGEGAAWGLRPPVGVASLARRRLLLRAGGGARRLRRRLGCERRVARGSLRHVALAREADEVAVRLRPNRPRLGCVTASCGITAWERDGARASSEPRVDSRSCACCVGVPSCSRSH